jgi:uncharacterized protein YraI
MSLKTKLAATGLAAALVLAAAVPAFAVTAYATTNVNVRSCASTSCNVRDVLQRGERVDVQYCEGAWCAVEKRGRDGFVNANYLSRDGGWDDDDDYYNEYDDDFYIERPRPRRHIRPVYPIYPSFGACVGGPNAKFCVYD